MVSQLHEREQELDRREAALAPPEPAPVPERLEPVQVAEPAATPPPSPVEGQWNLDRLERLVDQHGAEFPERVEEWRYYLLYLRDYAQADGSLPRSFDTLVAEVFEDLIERGRQAR